VSLRLVAASVLLGVFVSTGATPTPTTEPVFELHRTHQAEHLDPLDANPIFVLVIGSDIREGDPRRGRADSLHLVAINTETGRGTVVGIPRDSYVPIPGVGTRKINSGLVLGSPEALVGAVSQLSGLPIHYWALTEFSRFMAMVAELGGIEVEVPYRMADRLSGAFFDPGPRLLNGMEALAFARNRQDAPRGDFGRQENIGRLMVASVAKFRAEVSTPADVFRYLDVFRRHVESSVPTRELLRLARIGMRADPDGFGNVVLPGTTGTAAGASVVFLSPGMHEIFEAIRHDGEL
jgi:polyisoprenyl-teichoic acid--peptidoglycan teichoic acid transferase